MILLDTRRLVRRNFQRNRLGFTTGIILCHHHAVILHHTTVLVLCMQGDRDIRQVTAAIEVMDVYPEAGKPEYNCQ